jgi:tetratricopeptide (TPR) repeat protein
MQNSFKILFTSIILFSINANAQKSQVLIARNAIGKLQASIASKEDAKNQLSKITEGLKATDAAEKDNKTKNWAEVWAIKSYLTSYASLIDSDDASAEKYYNLSNDAVKQAIKLDKYEANINLIKASKHNLLIKKQNRATQLLNNNNFYDAIDDLKELSDYLPKDTTIALNAGLCALKIQNYDDAIKYLRRAKEGGIKNPAVFQKLGQLYISKYDNENALKILEDGLALNSFNKSITNDYINILLDLENFTKAQQLIESNLKVEKGSKLLYFLYGYLQQNSGNESTAILAYNNALSIDQNYFDALYQLGIAYINSANALPKNADDNTSNKYKSFISRAQFALQKANEINPNDRKTVKLLIDIYTQKNALDKVQELQRRLREF